MITNTDITKLKEVFATRAEFAGVKEELTDMKVELGEVHDEINTIAGTVARIENAVDKLSGNIQDLRTENSAGAMHLARHDRQIDALARESGIKVPD